MSGDTVLNIQRTRHDDVIGASAGARY